MIHGLVDYLMKGLQVNRGSPEGVLGFSIGLSALLSSSQFTDVGIPSNKAMEIFRYGEELLKTHFDGGKLSLSNIQSGWALIGAYLSLGKSKNVSTVHELISSTELGPSYVRVNLRNVITLWHNVFPHSRQELLQEMESGSTASWRHILESRNGALTCKL